ncbi:MAG: hypothetical protein ACFFCW_05865 [Candidatus Hodarchaeota archaeon]
MPKLIECSYCKKMALYDETHANRREKGRLLIWNCRYCLSQITHREEIIDSAPNAGTEKIEKIEYLRVAKEPVHSLSEPIKSSHEMSPISSPPKLDLLTSDSPPPDVKATKPFAKQPQVTGIKELKSTLTEITDGTSIARKFPSTPAEFELTEGSALEQVSSYERRIKHLFDEMQKFRDQTEKLERRISILTRRKSFILGSSLLVISFLSMIFAYISKDVLLEGMSIVAFFFGVGLLLISSERYVKSDIATLVSTSPLISLHAMLHQLGGQGPAIYLPPIQDEISGKLFVPWESNITGSFPTFEEIIQERVFIPEKGALLLPVGSQLLSLMEEELGADFLRGSLKNTLETIKRTLTLKTGLAQRAEFNIHGPNHFELVLTGSAYSQICRGVNKEDDLCDLLGCPICSMIATLVAKTTGDPVIIEKSNYDLATDTTNIKFHLRGWAEPRVQRLMRKQPSKPEAPSRTTEVRNNRLNQELEGLPVQEKKDIWYDEKVEQGYCPICEAPLNLRTGKCPNCGLEV